MSEMKDATGVMERSSGVSGERRLSVVVDRCGEYDTKQLRFTITGFDFGHPQYAYNILHVVRQEPGVKTAELFSQAGEVYVTLQPWQLVSDDLMVKLAKVIGADALGFPGKHIDVTVPLHP